MISQPFQDTNSNEKKYPRQYIQYAQELAAAALGSASLEVLSGVPIKEIREDKHTEMYLFNRGLGPTEGLVLAELLKGSGVLTNLNLAYNLLCGIEDGNGSYDPSGIQALADALKSGKAVLTVLDLQSNDIGVEGAEALADALRSGKAVLTHLNLSNNDLDAEAGKALASALAGDAVLAHLNLNGNSIGVEGAKALAGALKSGMAALTYLDVRRQGLNNEAKRALLDAVEDRKGVQLTL